MLKRMASMLMCVPLITPCITYKIPHKHFNITIAKKEVQCDFDKPINKLNSAFKQIEHGKEVIQNEMLNEIAISLKQLQDKQRAEEIERQKYIEVDFILTFYTSLSSENGGYTTTCRGENLNEIDGIVASNYYPLGTLIQLGNEFGQVEVGDKGSTKHFSVCNRLDVLIPREYGESTSHYYNRVNKMGRKTVHGRILKSSMNK